jgi:lysozyme family protein
MAANNFERCLAVTLKWEGGYSNNPDDPGGPTMRGIIQREYDAWRKKNGLAPRPVRQIEEDELQSIYRGEYWNAIGCEDLPAGLDLCVFDAAVNSGVGRAKEWLDQSREIDPYCDSRLAFLQRLGHLWRVFGAGWTRRVAGIRAQAHAFTGAQAELAPDDGSLHAGMKGDAVRELQERLRALGYPIGAVDGIFGEQVYRAVVIFQHDHDLNGEPGVWNPSYRTVLDKAKPMLPGRKSVTHRDLEKMGDRPIKRMNLLQRIFAWIFGASAVAQAFDGSSVLDSVTGMRNIVEPVQDVFAWVSSNRLFLVGAGCVAVIALIRLLRSEHVTAYQNFDYQGPAQAPEAGGKEI